jgi:outer membrane protein TolC
MIAKFARLEFELVTKPSKLAEIVSNLRLLVDFYPKHIKKEDKDFIYVLDAQRALFVAEDNLVVSSTEVTANLIRLYKALGGGWNHL